MAKKTERTLKLSAQGIEKANTALTKFGSVADLAAQIGAARKRTKGASPKTTVGMSRGTIYKFLSGDPVQRKEFHEICKKLGLKWQEIVDLPGINQPESAEKEQEQGTDIDELVREVRSRCCDKIQDQYSKIQLLNLQRIDVDQLYVEVYVLEKLTGESHATIPDLLKDSDLRNDFDRLGLGSRQKRAPGFEVAAQYSRLMILGKPGSGKSTFLRHLAVACCKGEFQADHIPILVELRDIKDASRFDLVNKIHKEFGLANQAQTEQILHQGKALILLDGLDEVPGQSRRDVQDHIYGFSQQYYKNRFILTCRTQTTEYTLSTFEYVEVADFNPEQVKIFAQNWFTALAETPEQGAELTVKFLENLRLPENKQTAELAVTPILLSLTCWVFNDLKGLPPKRSNLYEQAIKLLLEKWDEKRGVRRELGSEVYRMLSVVEKKKLLSYLAARKFEQEQYVLFEQGELLGYIAEYLGISTEDSEAVLDAVAAQHGLLIERALGFWSFSHLTFQEYFAAKWFCNFAGDDWKSLVIHITKKHWWEVFLLALGLLKNAEHLLLLMKEQVDALICSDEKLQECLMWVNQKSLSFIARYKPALIRLLYFTPAFRPIIVTRNSYSLNLSRETEYDIVRKSELVFSSTFDLADAIKYAYSYSHAITHDPDFILDRILIRIFATTYNFSVFHLNDIVLARAYASCLDSKLEQLLKHLLDQLLEPSKDRERFKEWWQANSQAWTEQLRAIMIEHRNIGHDWRFSHEQKELLQQYYDANNLLVNCLNSGCVVSDEVREKIEETLLLPIAEIEKRQQQM